jgi:glycogen synthase
MRTFRDRPVWRRMMREAMTRDFGWERSEERYLAVYRQVMRRASV